MTDIAPTHEPLKFAYWVPNVSGGLVISSIEQRTDWGYDYNVKLAQTAERVGFEYALSQVRYASSYGAAQQHESTSISLALLLNTEELKVISAIHPGIWHPAVLAKFINTADQFSHGRAAVNVVSGWFKDEYTDLGLEWLEHDERYERAAEFIQVLRGLWTQEKFSFHGKYYDITDFTLRPFPYEVPGRTHPDIFQGGNSTAARFNGGAFSDWYFSNGKDFDGFTEQYDDVTDRGRTWASHALRSQRFRHPTRQSGGSGAAASRDHRSRGRRRGRGLPQERARGRSVYQGRQGHVGRLLPRRPRAVQRRLPHAAVR